MAALWKHAGRSRITIPWVLRVALFMAVGVGFGLLWLQMRDPGFQIPSLPSDWFGVLVFSALLIALAFAVPTFARVVGGQVVFRVALVPAAGAALGGVSNILEDGLHVEGAFWLFVLGGAILTVGLAAFTVVVAFIGRGRSRFLAAIPARALVGWSLAPVGGGVLMSAAWLAAAAVVLRWPARANTRAAAIGQIL